ncbi:unnamed protein product, partial [Polarella glacialis]
DFPRVALLSAVVAGLSLRFASAMVEIEGRAVWIRGPAGSSCDVVCKARGGCREDSWPSTPAEFEEAALEANFQCVAPIQMGGSKYDPSTDGRYCGWQGPAPKAGEESRCAAVGDSGTHRFCPCYGDKEL